MPSQNHAPGVAQPAKYARRWAVPLGGALIALAGLAAYSNSFGAPFVYDDLTSILQNSSIRHLWPPWDVLSPPRGDGWTVDGRPILNLSLAINYAISGTHVWSYHAANLLIHILAGLALFGIVRRTLLERPTFNIQHPTSTSNNSISQKPSFSEATLLALAIAVIWVVHPLQTEAVTYVIQRAESLMGLFYLFSIYCFVRYATGRKPAWVWLSVCSCLLGLGTKEAMVTLPVMVFLLDRTFFSGSFLEAWHLRRRYYLALAATWLLPAVYLIYNSGNRGGAKGFDIGISWWAWILTQFEAVVCYLRLAIWPHPLVFSYGPFWVGAREAAPYALATLALAAATLWALVRKPAAGFLGFWFFGLLAPASLVPGISEMIAERRMYLPLAAVGSLIVSAIYARLGQRSLPFFFLVAAGFAGLTWQRNLVYHDDFSLWSDTATKRPLNGYAQYNLGVAYFNRGQIAEEIARYHTALQLNPDNFEAHHSLANELYHQGKFEEAESHYQAALAVRPDFASIHYDYGILLFAEGRKTEAIAQYEEAIRLKSDYAQAHDNLGIALEKIGRLPEAIAQFQEALKIEPGLARAHANLGGALASENRLEEAGTQYREALRLDPSLAGAHFFLGNVLSQEGRYAEAIGEYDALLQSNPDNADAHHNLGLALGAVGRTDEANEQLELAAKLGSQQAGTVR